SLRTVEVKDSEAVTRLRETWRALQGQCPDATPYQTWEWNEAWWRHYGARKRPRLLLFYAGQPGANLPVGIAPLYTGWYLGMPLRRRAWIGTGPSDYLGPLALPEYAAEVAAGLLHYLDRGMRGWDIADLQQARPDSPLMAHAPYPWRERPAESQAVWPME